MKRLVARFGRLRTASLAVMAVGLLLFLLTFPLYRYFGLDTDIPGLSLFVAGLALWVIGLRRRQVHGRARVALAILAAVLLVPVLILVLSLIVYLVTGREPGF
jgi:hypothetical protein